MQNLILASSSRYRKSLLERLQLSFKCVSPDFDERAQNNESAEHQVAELCFVDSADKSPRVLGKPGNHQRAVAQLSAQSGQTVKFYTAVTVLYQGQCNSALDITEVNFRDLSSAEIEGYLEADTPYDCAGSFKAESLGISLFESVKSDDPSALIGLPLIKLSKLLRDINNSAR
jgi:septum formation protein